MDSPTSFSRCPAIDTGLYPLLAPLWNIHHPLLSLSTVCSPTLFSLLLRPAVVWHLRGEKTRAPSAACLSIPSYNLWVSVSLLRYRPLIRRFFASPGCSHCWCGGGGGRGGGKLLPESPSEKEAVRDGALRCSASLSLSTMRTSIPPSLPPSSQSPPSNHSLPTHTHIHTRLHTNSIAGENRIARCSQKNLHAVFFKQNV